MSKRWATIVYGRTYHLDFRFITVPHDFSASDITWASRHIVATTQQARNLAGSPRWSLFKNDNYCIVGVTCTVKDLIGHTVKDDQGRPLYVFVGYVTILESNQPQLIPAFDSTCLDNFKVLYQEIEKVWLIKNYERDSRQPARSQYCEIKFCNSALATPILQVPQLNQDSKQPDKTYVWQSLVQQNNLLWLASAQCLPPIATCLNIKGKALTNSPFLNQSSDRVEQFQILERHLPGKTQLETRERTIVRPNSLPQKLAHRAKEDIDLTIQQASKMAIASQELIDRLDWSGTEVVEVVENEFDDSDTEADNFGFKTKKPASPSQQDWF